MSDHVRIRCPICGMLGWQSRLAKDFPFEVLIQHTTSRGRGKITNTYSEPETEHGVFMLKIALADKMEAVARELREEAGAEITDQWSDYAKAGDWESARAVTKARFSSTFESMSSAASGSHVGWDSVSFPVARVQVGPVHEVYEAEYEAAESDDDSQDVSTIVPLLVSLGKSAFREQRASTSLVAGTQQRSVESDSQVEMVAPGEVTTRAVVEQETTAHTVSTQGRNSDDEIRVKARTRIG